MVAPAPPRTTSGPSHRPIATGHGRGDVGGAWHHLGVSKQDGRNRLVSDAPVDDVSATVLHVDMDAFFASVELLDRPDLVGLPVIVGHDSDRSVVTAATYEARRYGVNSAMPMAVAKRRCPNAVIVEPHFEKYRAQSAAVMAIFDRFTPRVERLGIDEAFLDVAGALRLYGTPWQIGQAIRRTVFAETGLHCSVGAASTKFVAKLASSRSKPDGLLVVPAADTVAFLHPQPVSALWGVGGKTQETLERRGIRTVGDLANTPLGSLVSALGPAGGQRLHDLSWGRDPRVVDTGVGEKSIGHEVTFGRDLTERDDVAREPPAPGRQGRRPPAPGRRAGPDRGSQGPLHRLQHPDPVAHPGGAHRRREAPAPRSRRAVRRPAPTGQPDPVDRGPWREPRARGREQRPVGRRRAVA